MRLLWFRSRGAESACMLRPSTMGGRMVVTLNAAVGPAM